MIEVEGGGWTEEDRVSPSQLRLCNKTPLNPPIIPQILVTNPIPPCYNVLSITLIYVVFLSLLETFNKESGKSGIIQFLKEGSFQQ